MMRQSGDELCSLRIPDDTVSIGTDGNTTLLWIEIEDSGSISTGHRDELIQVKFASFDTFGPQD